MHTTMKRVFVLFVVTVSVALTGCISTSVAPLTGKTYPAVHADEVTIYLRDDDIPGAYEKIAIIYARGDYALTDEAQMFKSVRKKAAKLGANGVLLQEVSEPGTGAKVANHLLGTGADRKGELVAIYVKPVGDEAANAPSIQRQVD